MRVGTPQQRMALLVGGVMDGALVPLDVDVQQHEVFDSDRGPQRYEATSEVTASGHQVFALVEKPQA